MSKNCKRIKKKCPYCGGKIKKIVYGMPKDVNNYNFYYAGCMPIGSQFKYYCESCDRALTEENVNKKNNWQ